MRKSSPIRHSGDTGASTPTGTPSRRATSDAAWEEKWQSMVDHQKQRREQDAILRQKLQEKQEMEEYIECTFTPKTHCSYKSRSPDELLKVMNPLISEERKILEELKNLEVEEANNVGNLSGDLRAHIASNQGGEGDELIRICERYREERLKELSRVKNRKLDIVGLLHEVERKYNVICVREHLSEDEMSRAGFNIETCRRIKKEILDSVKGVDTLKDRSRVTAEIETIIKKAKEDAEHQRMYPPPPSPQHHHHNHMGHYFPQGMPMMGQPRLLPQMGTRVSYPTGLQVPYPMVQQGMKPGVLPMFGGAKVVPLNPQQMMGQPMRVKMPSQQPKVWQAPVMQGTRPMVASQLPPSPPQPGFVPVNSQFGPVVMQRPNAGPIMFQRNRPRKLQQ